MRPASIIAAVVFMFASASSAAAFPGVTIQPCDEQPPAWARQPVIGPVWIYTIPASEMNARCNKEPGVAIGGCTALANDKHPAIIFLSALLSSAERECVLRYEKAHLPPNNWLDPTAEARAADMPGVASPNSLPGLVHATHE